MNPVQVATVLVTRMLSLHFLHHLLPKGADFGRTGDYHVLRTLILTRNSVERSALFLDVSVQIRPEFDQEESICWSFVVELLQPTLLLREFVVDLLDIHCLKVGVCEGGVCLPNVHKQVLVVLEISTEFWILLCLDLVVVPKMLRTPTCGACSLQCFVLAREGMSGHLRGQQGHRTLAYEEEAKSGQHMSVEQMVSHLGKSRLDLIGPRAKNLLQ